MHTHTHTVIVLMGRGGRREEQRDCVLAMGQRIKGSDQPWWGISRCYQCQTVGGFFYFFFTPNVHALHPTSSDAKLWSTDGTRAPLLCCPPVLALPSQTFRTSVRLFLHVTVRRVRTHTFCSLKLLFTLHSVEPIKQFAEKHLLRHIAATPSPWHQELLSEKKIREKLGSAGCSRPPHPKLEAIHFNATVFRSQSSCQEFGLVLRFLGEKAFLNGSASSCNQQK